MSLYNANVWPAAIFPALALALVYGGLAQLLAGMWEFVRKNTFGALAFTSYGAFWISYYVFVHFLGPGHQGRPLPTPTGVFLLGWTILTFYLMIASLRVSGAVLGVFVALTVTFVLLTIGTSSRTTAIIHAGGWVGIVTAAIAFYASAAGVINETFKKALHPGVPARAQGLGRAVSGQARRATCPRAGNPDHEEQAMSDDEKRACPPSCTRPGRFHRRRSWLAEGQRPARHLRRGRRRPAGLLGRAGRAADLGRPVDADVSTGSRPFAKWFVGGTLNVAVNCVDRHVDAGLGTGSPSTGRASRATPGPSPTPIS